MMIVLPFSSFIVCVIHIHFGLYALTQNKNKLIHKLFFGAAIICAYWSFCIVLFHLVQNKNIATNIYLLSLTGPFFLPAIVTHTILAITLQKKGVAFFYLFTIMYKYNWIIYPGYDSE